MVDVVVPVFAGAVIGYVTNWLAIKMLFWPREEKRILGIKVPLTPGLFVRRRITFSASIADLVESRFSNADDLYAVVQRAEHQGLIDQFLASMNPLLRIAFVGYMKRTSPEEFKSDCEKFAASMRRAKLVSKTIRQKIDEMPTMEIESMVLGVVQREFRAITWVGALLGAAIGAVQMFL